MGLDRRPALELLAEFLARNEAGEQLEFEAWVRSFPDHERELRDLQQALPRVSSLIRKGRAGSFFGKREEQFEGLTPGVSIGQVVGGYRLVAKIGEGGMGQVWEAEQLSLGRRRVAIKFVRPDLASPRSLELFQREARAAGRLNHDGIVRVHDYGEDGELAWIAMEYVDGCWTLRDFLETSAEGCLAKDDYDENVSRFFAQAAKAMDAAHRAGVVHRDLKPQNILINEDDRPKITDFGLARIQGETAILKLGELAGTRAYMSPEQVTAGHMGIDHRTDVFSLGLVLFETLTLEHPFRDPDPMRTAENIVTKPAPAPSSSRPGIAECLDRVCLKALHKERDARFQSMGEFADALTPAALTQTTEIIARPGAERRAPRELTAPALLACAALMLYFALGGWLMLDIGVRTREAHAAPRNPVTSNEVEYANQELARLDAEDSQLSRYFPWWNLLPTLLALTTTAAAFGGLAGCLRAWRPTARGMRVPTQPLLLPVLGALGGMLVTGLANATAPQLLLETREGILALLGTCLALGYFVSPWIHVRPRRP